MINAKRLVFLIALFGILLAGASSALADGPTLVPIPECLACTDLFAPVVCDGGLRFTNPCFARCAGATNCVPDDFFAFQR